MFSKIYLEYERYPIDLDFSLEKDINDVKKIAEIRKILIFDPSMIKTSVDEKTLMNQDARREITDK